MKSSKNLLEQLKNMPYFSKAIITQLGKDLGLTEATISTYVSRFLKHKEIISLKNGLYVTTNFFEKNKNDLSYIFYIANILRTPSYISLWTALDYYNLATDVVYGVNSVTIKNTKNFKSKAGNFSFNSINKNLFSDFSLKKGKFNFFIASPSKALFDLLYFRNNQLRGMKLEEVKKQIDDLRIDFEEMDETEKKKFFSRISEFL